MRRKNFDYRFCIKESLQTLKTQREKLCADSSFAHNSVIYSGLHEFESNYQRDLYFQAYLIEWIDTHWNDINGLMDNNQDLTISERKQMIIFFAEYFSELISECSSMGLLEKLVIPDLLKIKKKIIQNMIQAADKWTEQNEQLKADKKKHKEKFKRLIESEQKVGNLK